MQFLYINWVTYLIHLGLAVVVDILFDVMER